MGFGARGIKRLGVVLAIIIFAGFKGLIEGIDNLASNFSWGSLFSLVWEGFKSATNNLFASLWIRINSIIPNIQNKNVGSMFVDVFYIALALILIYQFVYIIGDFITQDEQVPKYLIAIISLVILLLLAYFMKDVGTTTLITNSTIENARNNTLINLAGG